MHAQLAAQLTFCGRQMLRRRRITNAKLLKGRFRRVFGNGAGNFNCAFEAVTQRLFEWLNGYDP